MSAKSSPVPGATGAFSEPVLDYFAAHGIDPEVATVLGIAQTAKGISIPYRDGTGREMYRRERDFAAKATYPPKGTKAEPWTPVGTDGWLLVCEGESDCMAAISALYEIDRDLLGDPDYADDGPEVLLRRRPDLPPPLEQATPVALPGAGVCHRQLADLAEELISDVVLVLDGDDAGRAAAAKLAEQLSARKHVEVRVADLPDGQDLADVLAGAGDPTGALADLVAEAEAEKVPVEGDVDGAEGEQSGDGGDKRKPTQSELLLALAHESGIELWATKEGDPFMTVPVGQHVENHRLSTRASRDWLAHLFYREHERPPSAQALQDALGVLRGKALYDGGRSEAPVRHAAVDGKIYIDLGDPNWRAVEVDAEGWRIVAESPVRFRRPRGMLPLPEPETGRTLDGLRNLLNVDDDGWKLIVGWLVGALAPDGPYPILGLHGEQGAAKSSAARLLRDLVDPNVAGLRSEPRDEHDLVIAASNGRIVALDNVSSLSANLSDALCRLATGGGFATRELYSDAEEIIFSAVRPAIITGIAEVASRGDLLDRSILVTLEPISEADRLTEADLESRWADVAPAAFGALLDAASTALRRLPDVSLKRLPRMADHALWVTAAEPALCWDQGTYLKVYGEAREAAVETALDSSPLTEPIRKLAVVGFEGSATALLAELDDQAGEAVTRSRAWPKSARSLSSALRRLAPDLRSYGIEIESRRVHGGRRVLRIEQRGNPASPASPASPSALQSELGGDAKGDARGQGDASANGLPHRSNGSVEPKTNAGDAGDANSATHSNGQVATPAEEAEIERVAAKLGGAA